MWKYILSFLAGAIACGAVVFAIFTGEVGDLERKARETDRALVESTRSNRILRESNQYAQSEIKRSEGIADGLRRSYREATEYSRRLESSVAASTKRISELEQELDGWRRKSGRLGSLIEQCLDIVAESRSGISAAKRLVGEIQDIVRGLQEGQL